MIGHFFSRPAVEAKRRGESLIAAFHRANPPLIWRFDLERNHSFTLALQGDEGEWELGLSSPKGDFNPVARFPLREDAEEAFARVERILAQSKRGWSFYLTRFLALLAVVVLVGVVVVVYLGIHEVNSMIPKIPTGAAFSQSSQHQDVRPQEELLPLKNGVPIPADDVLRPPAP